MLLYPGFTFSFVTLFVLLILITLRFIIPCNLSFIRRGEKFNSRAADQFCRQFTFAEIRTATRNFSHELVIGKGGFGKVFKGVIDNGATEVAIKRLDPMSKQGGAARGLDYLHTGTGILHRVIHRDVKSSNILLDENWAAKVSDFGLSKIGPANQSVTHVSTHVKGTQGYCDPEYFLTRRLTRKSNVYSFGVVLFEVLCGRPVFDYKLPKEQISLVLWAQHCMQKDKTHLLIDPNLKWDVFENSLKAFVKIAGQCLENSKKRPTMSEVVASLEVALVLQLKKDSSLLDEDIFDFGETYDYQEVVGCSSLHSDNVYTDSPTTLVPLSHSPTTGPIEGIEKPSSGEGTLRKDTPGGSASETLSKIEGNMTCEEQIIDNILVSSSTALVTLSHSPPTGPIEGIEKPSSGEGTLREDTPAGSASETSSKIMGNMTCEEQINDNILVSSSTALVPLSHCPPTGPIEGIEKSSSREGTLREDTPGGSASETLSKIKGDMTCEQQINDNILVSEVASSLEVVPALQEKGSSVFDQDFCKFGETFDNRDMEGCSTVLPDIAYTDDHVLVFFEGMKWTFELGDFFRAEAEKLGMGTYKAKLKDSTVLVVKRFNEHSVMKRKFMHHMNIVGSIRHENVAPCRAYYNSKEEMFMVYDYYNQGSVSVMLHSKRGEGRTPLDWETRLKIAVGAARGIAYIHTQIDGKLAHGNIKASNIFLNSQQHGCVSEHGLTTLINQAVPPNAEIDGYQAPEMTKTSKVSQASDVYSYGVFLLELLTGKGDDETAADRDGMRKKSGKEETEDVRCGENGRRHSKGLIMETVLRQKLKSEVSMPTPIQLTAAEIVPSSIP
ncbi:hypothetical protein LguiA_002287 [Lonicera macranthoides]